MSPSASSRLPPSLDFLVIWNATLKPPEGTSKDDEDAEELAHILFYTARQRAVSRDRMLRQVGLAKALINFSDMFNKEPGCDNVHSQKRRLVMVSPEQDYWIHASFDIAKTPRPQKAKDTQPVTYDYHESSLHDSALRSHILRGYEEFKLLHGSFASVLAQGKATLERQLERFFTVWAWKWDVDSPAEFGQYLGTPIHPSQASVSPLIDAFTTILPERTIPIIMSPPYLLTSPSTSYPPSLPSYLLSIAPPPRPRSRRNNSNTASASGAAKGANANGTTGIGQGTMNFFAAIPNVKKWGTAWPGYLTFGGAKKPEAKPAPSNGPPVPNSDAATTTTEPCQTEVDQKSLDEAISSDEPIANPMPQEKDPSAEDPELQAPSSPTAPSNGPAETESAESPETPRPLKHLPETESIPDGIDISSSPSSISPSLPEAMPPAEPPNQDHEATAAADPEPALPPSSAASVSDEPATTPNLSQASASPATPPTDSLSTTPSQSTTSVDSIPPSAPEAPRPPLFLRLSIHLSDPSDPSVDERRRVAHATKHGILFALLMPDNEDADLSGLEDDVLSLLRRIDRELRTTRTTPDNASPAPTPSRTTTTGIGTKYAVASKDTQTVLTNPGFLSTSGWLFEGRNAISEVATLEQFSRTTSSQSWYISKRTRSGKEVHLEVGRKEASLTDVDNELAGVVRRWAS